MRFLLLGPPEVEVRGARPDLGTPKQRAVLVRLLLEAPRAVSVDRLVEDLWAGEPPARASASLQAYVSNLRRILEPDRDPRAPAALLVTRPPGYAVAAPPGAVDVELAERGRREAGALLAAEPARALDAAESALRLWRGPALEGLRDESFRAEAARLDGLRTDLEELRVRALLALGRDADAVVGAEALVELDRLREGSWEALVVALYRAGRPAAALDACRRFARLLDEELGLEPGPRLRELETAALRHDQAVLGPPAAPRPPVARPAPARAASRLVGRADLLAEVGEVLADGAAGGPRWVVLRGEAGIGKTTLLGELEDRAEAEGRRVVRAVAHEDPDVPAYWLWSQVLRGLPGEGGTLAGATASARAAGGDAARFVIYEGVRDALDRAAAEAPLLVTLDDLQWADGDSLRLTRFLTTQLRSPSIAVLATLREGEDRDTPALPETLAAFARAPGGRSFPVPPLGAAEVRRVAADAAGARATPDVLDRVASRAGGNPFFAAELARLAALEPRSADGAAPLPLAVRDVVDRRLRRLPESVRGTLALGAVLGAAFDVPVLAAVEGLDVGEQLERLDPAVAGGVLREDGTPLRLRFTHALLREALLGDLGAPRRRRAHARIAAVLERRGAGTGDAELAHHLVEAGAMGDLAAARASATAVGRERAGALAYDEAARWFARALDVEQQERALGDGDPSARFELLLHRADALFHSGQVVAARQVLLPAVQLATGNGDSAAVARAAAALSRTGGIWTWVDMGEVSPTLVGLLEQGLARLGREPSPATVRLLLALAMGQYYGPDPARVDALSAEAVAMARGIGDPGLLADALLDRAFAIRLPDRPDEVVALGEETLALPGLTEEQVVVAHARRFYGLLHLGDLPAAIAAHVRATAAAERAHLMGPALQLGHFPAGVAAAEARFDDAERLLADAEAREAAGDQPALAISRAGVHTVVAWLRGDLVGMLDELAALAEAVPLRTGRRIHAHALLLAGEEDAARAAWTASRSGIRTPWLELVDACLEVELRAALEPRPPAGAPDDEDVALLELLGPRAGMIAAAGTGYPFVPVGLALGVHEHRLGLLDDAERHLRSVLARSDAWGTLAWSALCRARLADVLEDVALQAPSADLTAQVARLRAEAGAVAARTGLVLPAHRRPGGGPAVYNQLRRLKVR